MREIRTSGSMSGEGKRSDATAPLLDSTSHPDETFVGRIEKDFNFLDYHFGPDGLSVAKNTV